jgi:hypothetical protein
MKNISTFMMLFFLSHLAFGQGGTREVLICNGSNVRLKALSVGATGYEWHKDGSIIPGFAGAELVVNEEGHYTALALNADGCVSDLSVVVIIEFRKPVAVNDYVKGVRNLPAVVDALYNDEASCTDLDPLTILINTEPSHGSVNIINGQFSYNPGKDFSAEDTFTYTVRDKNGQESNVATVTVDYSGALPVSLTEFTALKQETTTLLSWITTSENNSDHFVIERSIDGKSWISITKVGATGSSTQEQKYQTTDNLPESGINYYRLKMVDHDNSFSYSQVRSVHFPEFSWANVYPNPVRHSLNIKIRNKKVRKLRLIDSSGKILLQSDVRSADMELNMQPYTSGVFFVHLEQENGLVAIFKIFHD